MSQWLWQFTLWRYAVITVVHYSPASVAEWVAKRTPLEQALRRFIWEEKINGRW